MKNGAPADPASGKNPPIAPKQAIERSATSKRTRRLANRGLFTRGTKIANRPNFRAALAAIKIDAAIEAITEIGRTRATGETKRANLNCRFWGNGARSGVRTRGTAILALPADLNGQINRARLGAGAFTSHEV